jgi:molybdopterin/thiamine biosynthesis adenylyltransferase
MNEPLKLASGDGRFARFELMAWWDQQRLAKAKVLLIGAGALGNEILKNLALLGVGSVFVADMDVVEITNLSRSVLFRQEDCGQPKARVVARRAAAIYPAIQIQPFCGNVVYELGLGVYRWADVVLGALDSREARVAINRAAARAGKPWIDGAIERLDGVARVFDPACGPCYECTMNDIDWKMLESRRSCALLSRDEVAEGKVPTTPTTASIIAGIQCQEAVKLIHGLETLAGRGFVFDGMSHNSYVVAYTRKDDCPSHDPDAEPEPLAWRVAETRIGDFLDRVRSDLGPSAIVETNADLLASLYCPKCETDETMLTALNRVSQERGRCPRCREHRVPKTFHTIDGREPFLDRTLGEVGVPPWDVLAGRAGMEQRLYEFAGDRREVLGPLTL